MAVPLSLRQLGVTVSVTQVDPVKETDPITTVVEVKVTHAADRPSQLHDLIEQEIRRQASHFVQNLEALRF